MSCLRCRQWDISLGTRVAQMGYHAVMQAGMTKTQLRHHPVRVKAILSSDGSGTTKPVMIGTAMIAAGEGAEVGSGSEEMGKQTENERYRCCSP